MERRNAAWSDTSCRYTAAFSYRAFVKSVAIFEPIMHQNAFAAGALSGTPLGKLTALPQIPQLVSGATPWQGREGRKGAGRKK